MVSKQHWLDELAKFYDSRADNWTDHESDAVNAMYERFGDLQDQHLFPENIDTSCMSVLEYGCGTGRNLWRYKNNFDYLRGVDISQSALKKAKKTICNNWLSTRHLDVKKVENSVIPYRDRVFDMVFSVLTFQLISPFNVRSDIFSECHRVLQPNGWFCFQMGYGNKDNRFGEEYNSTSGYWENHFDRTEFDGHFDVRVDSEDDIYKHLTDLGFHNIDIQFTESGIGEGFDKWIWVHAQKREDV
tara:strand:- start:1263 stop:1994 length:732 start_codon:yes stop_codon:yes gene_type:complete